MRTCSTSRGGRSLSDAIDHLLDGGQVAFDMGFNATIRAIADPAHHSEGCRLLTHPGAKENTLHAACHADVARDGGHHTVEISGASSAFMPTTL